MPNLGMTELLLILGIIILLVGASRLPEIGKGLGQGIRGFRTALSDEEKPEQASSKSEVEEEAGG
jgi:sec-independent protein translocase protein TatA